MVLPLELQKLPPQALDVIRYLGTEEDGGADIDTILNGTGLSERAFGKAIRRLVTRYYVEMPDTGYYVLTERGFEAVDELRVYDGDEPAPPADAPVSPAETPAPPEISPEPEVRPIRRLSVFLPKELVSDSTTALRIGFDAPAPDQARLAQPGRLILRLSAPGCDVEPVERPLEVPVHAAAGPVQFRITPRQSGTVRVKVAAYQLVSQGDLRMVGGMFFDRPVAGFPTPGSVEFQTLGTTVALIPAARS